MTGNVGGEITADEVMLNPEYLRKLREEEARKSALWRLPTKEEMDEMFKDKDIFSRLMTFFSTQKKGFSARPTFSMKEVIDRQGRRRMIPFFGIQGTF